MPEPAKPNISFAVRIDLETDKRRKRLQRKFGFSGPELVRRAFETFEASLTGDSREVRPAA
jgi:hypothetical protein